MAVQKDPSLSRTLAQHLKLVLRPYHVWLPILVALGFGGATAAITVLLNVESDLARIRSISPEVAHVLQTGASSDLEDLIRNISDEYHGHLMVLQDGKVIASSCAHPEFHHKIGFLPLKRGIYITPRRLISEIELNLNEKSGSPTYLRLSTPFDEVFGPAKFLSIIVLGLSWLVSRFYGKRMMKAVNTALTPISRLETAIRDLKTLKDPKDLYKTGISELDAIRQAILETHRALSNARDTIAHIKAKDLATETYKHLIHDLEKLVKSLRNQIRLLGDADLDDNTRKEVLALIPETADQLLSQMTTGRNNLDLEAKVLPEKDVIPVVREAISNAWYSSSCAPNIKLELDFPNDSISVAHDPHLLRRAIANLVHNAFDAAKSKIRIALAAKDSGMMIRIEDDGPGIPDSDVGPYLQGRKTSTKGDRLAYGLAATSHIIRSHGGRLTYQRSNLGGACFEVFL